MEAFDSGYIESEVQSWVTHTHKLSVVCSGKSLVCTCVLFECTRGHQKNTPPHKLVIICSSEAQVV